MPKLKTNVLVDGSVLLAGSDVSAEQAKGMRPELFESAGKADEQSAPEPATEKQDDATAEEEPKPKRGRPRKNA